MKSLLTALALLFLSVTHVTAQEVEMVIHMKDGNEARFNIDSVAKLTATAVQPPYYRVVTYRAMYPMHGSSGLFGSDSITFLRRQDGVFLRGPGSYSKIAGNPFPPPPDFTEALVFDITIQGENVRRLTDLQTSTDHVATAWSDSTIYSAGSGDHWRYRLDTAYNVVSANPLNSNWAHFNIELSGDGSKLAYSLMSRREFVGRLAELDLKSGKIDTLTLDSSVSTARYIGSTGDMVYYSFGSYDYHTNPKPEDAGYYRLDRSTGVSTFLLNHPPLSSPEGELLNGFDVSSDGRKLLVPTASSDRQQLVLAEFDIESGRLDTLDVNLNPPEWYNTLWVQYNRDDSKILYSLSWIARVPSFLASESSVGIIDRENLQTQRLFVSPTNARPFSAPYPRWSPDETAICYGGCILPTHVLDSTGPFHIYIKKL